MHGRLLVLHLILTKKLAGLEDQVKKLLTLKVITTRTYISGKSCWDGVALDGDVT